MWERARTGEKAGEQRCRGEQPLSLSVGSLPLAKLQVVSGGKPRGESCRPTLCGWPLHNLFNNRGALRSCRPSSRDQRGPFSKKAPFFL